jgi:hypothetical protein
VAVRLPGVAGARGRRGRRQRLRAALRAEHRGDRMALSPLEAYLAPSGLGERGLGKTEGIHSTIFHRIDGDTDELLLLSALSLHSLSGKYWSYHHDCQSQRREGKAPPARRKERMCRQETGRIR